MTDSSASRRSSSSRSTSTRARAHSSTSRSAGPAPQCEGLAEGEDRAVGLAQRQHLVALADQALEPAGVDLVVRELQPVAVGGT